jgi:type IV pilus assembly protein PilB
MDDGASKEPLGEILIKRGLIKAEQLAQALEIQKQEKILIGEILLRLGFISETDIVVALIMQNNLPYIAINKYNLNKEVVQLIPEDTARRFHVVALEKAGQTLSVVMEDPLNPEVRTQLETTTKCKIAPFIGTKSEIDQAINKWYGK